MPGATDAHPDDGGDRAAFLYTASTTLGRWLSGSSGSPPASITVAETLALLETRFAGFADGLADGRYVLWLGSGVSRDRLPGLRELVRKVLEFLHARIASGPDGKHYRRALEKAVTLGLRAREAEEVDVSEPVASWPRLDDLLDSLVERYSELLGIQVDGEEADFLLWDAIDVRGTYGPGHVPDCEHLCIAILALEGAVAEVASPNWDGLIEAAFTELGTSASNFLRIVVLADEVRGVERSLMLIKFHGCAVLATEDPPRYRGALVASRKQITAWIASDAHRVVRGELVQLATKKPGLVIGLSAQDENIQQIFAQAANAMNWTWPSDPPSHVFASGSLSDHHINILRVIYGEESACEMETEVLVPAYGKAFLPALVLYVLARKLRAYLAEAEAPQLSSAERAELADGLGGLAKQLAEVVGTDPLAFVENLAAGQGRTLALFQDGTEPSGAGAAAFRPLGGLPAERVKTDPALPTSGVRELAAALALLGRGAAVSIWKLAACVAEAAGDAPVEVTSASRSSMVFFAANGRAATRLVAEGLVDPTAADAVIIHSTDPVERAPRSPRGRYGRTGTTRMRQVDMCDLLKTSPDLLTLETRFRQVAGL